MSSKPAAAQQNTSVGGFRDLVRSYLIGEKLSDSAKMTILLILVVAFPIVAQLLVPFVDIDSLRILTVLPVIITSAFFGAKVGLVFIVYVFVFSYVVFRAIGVEFELTTPNLLILSFALAVIGYVIGSASDISREQRKLAKSLKVKESTYKVIYTAVQEYMEDGSFEQTMIHFLEQLGKKINVSRVYLFMNDFDSLKDEELTVTQLFEWSADDVTSQKNNDEMIRFDIKKHGMLSIFKNMKKNGYVSMKESEFPQEVMKVFSEQEIRSFINVPVYVESRFWGFIGFDDVLEERNWSEEEIEVLKLVAAVIGSMITHRDSQDELASKAKELQDMNDVLVGRELEIKKVKNELHTIKDTAPTDGQEE